MDDYSFYIAVNRFYTQFDVQSYFVNPKVEEDFNQQFKTNNFESFTEKSAKEPFEHMKSLLERKVQQGFQMTCQGGVADIGFRTPIIVILLND